MVTIVGYNQRISKENKAFYTLDLQGEIETVKSKDTGKYYITARKASVISTFDENTCKRMIGQELPGTIQREACEPYAYQINGTDEVIELAHTFVYQPEEAEPTLSKVITKMTTQVKNGKDYSKNGSVVGV